MTTQAWHSAAGVLDEVAPQVREALRCPVTGEELVEVRGTSGEPGLASRGAGLVYPVRDGVPVLLVHEASTLEG
ncbi:Trm112 family protein [Actinomyces faecalis]|uniref:Trm112 family protein n=1 Tax=Actinomyces faecalis TaxID=2722820 RepID=UPI001551CF5E|nr:hypothetical protein [Actinomyces faecalis]